MHPASVIGGQARVCAIHQPNLFPRWVTLAKLLAADTWVILDDVQFSRRGYQHRARLGHPDRAERQWLVLPVHLPRGRATAIRDVRLADPVIARRRVSLLTRQHYRRTPGWSRIAPIIDSLADLIGSTEPRDGIHLGEIAEASTALLLDAYGWRGHIIRSSLLARHNPISTERSERLADLTRAAGCDTYLCGRGGRSYLDPAPFVRAGQTVSQFELPANVREPLADLTALAALATQPTRVPVALTPRAPAVGVPSSVPCRGSSTLVPHTNLS